ncbi:uncharacterized protein LOC126797003 [Argentina anserina]|uniref:uncharacterized protein LOC126797003 n=1 Tax=Argentina anserina TaxID=57926 RepID=UPI002176666F|nr:uncharacterized protein LOC126797003 [Potentilla anserina]
MTSNLIRIVSHEAKNPVDCSLKKTFELLEPNLRPPWAVTILTPHEHLLLNKVILYGILCETHCAKTHIKHLHAMVINGYGLFANLIYEIVNELYTKLVEPKIVGGDYSDGNSWLCFEIVIMFLAKWDSLVEVDPMTLTSRLYTYLRLIGRDVVWLLQDLVHIPNIRSIWKDLALNQGSFKTLGYFVISLLYNTRTSSRYTSDSPELETQLRFLVFYMRKVWESKAIPGMTTHQTKSFKQISFPDKLVYDVELRGSIVRGVSSSLRVPVRKGVIALLMS